MGFRLQAPLPTVRFKQKQNPSKNWQKARAISSALSSSILSEPGRELAAHFSGSLRLLHIQWNFKCFSTSAANATTALWCQDRPSQCTTGQCMRPNPNYRNRILKGKWCQRTQRSTNCLTSFEIFGYLLRQDMVSLWAHQRPPLTLQPSCNSSRLLLAANYEFPQLSAF